MDLARLAQSVEHGTLNPRVVGSSPTLGALDFSPENVMRMFSRLIVMFCLGTPWRPLETLLSLEVQWKVEKANYLDSDAGSAEI